MKIRFSHDFRGKLTRELFYVAGTEIEVEDSVAAELIALGHAVAVEDVPEVEVLPDLEPEQEQASAKVVRRGKPA